MRMRSAAPDRKARRPDFIMHFKLSERVDPTTFFAVCHANMGTSIEQTGLKKQKGPPDLAAGRATGSSF